MHSSLHVSRSQALYHSFFFFLFTFVSNRGLLRPRILFASGSRKSHCMSIRRRAQRAGSNSNSYGSASTLRVRLFCMGKRWSGEKACLKLPEFGSRHFNRVLGCFQTKSEAELEPAHSVSMDRRQYCGIPRRSGWSRVRSKARRPPSLAATWRPARGPSMTPPIDFNFAQQAGGPLRPY